MWSDHQRPSYYSSSGSVQANTSSQKWSGYQSGPNAINVPSNNQSSFLCPKCGEAVKSETVRERDPVTNKTRLVLRSHRCREEKEKYDRKRDQDRERKRQEEERKRQEEERKRLEERKRQEEMERLKEQEKRPTKKLKSILKKSSAYDNEMDAQFEAGFNKFSPMEADDDLDLAPAAPLPPPLTPLVTTKVIRRPRPSINGFSPEEGWDEEEVVLYHCPKCVEGGMSWEQWGRHQRRGVHGRPRI